VSDVVQDYSSTLENASGTETVNSSANNEFYRRLSD
jgi:hypothetical protein